MARRARERAPSPPEAGAPAFLFRPETVLFAAALALRLAHLAFHRGDFWLTVPLLDDSVFETWADVIAREGWKAASLGAFDFNPAYPYFLTAFRAVFGRSQLVLFFVQHAAGALVAPLLYKVTERAFDRRAGWAAGLLAAAYGPSLFFESRLLGECWILLANVTALWLLGGAGEASRPWRSWGLAGLALGVSAAFRPTALALLPVAALWAASTLKDRPPELARAGAAFALGLWLPLLPFQLRNRAVLPGAGWGLTTSSGGVNLYLGNNPEADGLNQAPSFVRYGPDHQYQDFADEAGRRLGFPPSRAQVSAFWSAEARRFWKDQTGTAARLALRKVGFFWNHKEAPDNFFLEIFRRFTRLGALPLASWGLVAPLGLAGLVWGWAAGRRAWLLYGYTLAYFGVCVAFYVLSRYRFPAAAGLIPFAGLAAARVYESLKDRAWRPGASLALLSLAGLLLSRLPLIGEEDQGTSHYSMAVVYANRGWKDQALEEYRASVAADPSFRASWMNMGLLLVEQGRGPEAVAALRRAAELEPDA
ncbi:MAG: hypothetical protein FD126_2509, partial [Elusimicrobia bacterium]